MLHACSCVIVRHRLQEDYFRVMWNQEEESLSCVYHLFCSVEEMRIQESGCFTRVLKQKLSGFVEKTEGKDQDIGIFIQVLTVPAAGK